MADFLPRADEQLLGWSLAFRDRIVLEHEAYGLTEQQAADYDEAHAAMAALLAQAAAAHTRTPVVIILKNESVAALRALARQYARMIRANPAVDSAQRQSLGLGAGGAKAVRIHTPATAPTIRIDAAIGQRVTLRLMNQAEQSRRGIPRGTIGAAIFACASETMPGPDDFWQPQGHTSTYLTTVEFPTTVKAGTQVWFVAQWLNPRLQPGPMSRAVPARVQGGLGTGKSLKIAA